MARDVEKKTCALPSTVRSEHLPRYVTRCQGARHIIHVLCAWKGGKCKECGQGRREKEGDLLARVQACSHHVFTSYPSARPIPNTIITKKLG